MLDPQPLGAHATRSEHRGAGSIAPASVAPSSPLGTIVLSSAMLKLSSCSCSRQEAWWDRSAALAASA
eukprot:scaffold18865_cov65-Isochrysis_galbana.AAC.1